MSDRDAPMSDRDALRYAARRAMLRQAIQGGDAVAAARAASRLRVDGYPVAPEEFAHARQARHTLGLALVKARMPRREDAPLRREGAIPAPPARSHWRLLAAIGAAAALVVVLVFGTGVGLRPDGGSPPQAASEPQRAALLTSSRGRTITLPTDLVVVRESPTPAPTAEPTAATAAPATFAPAPTRGAGGGTASGTPGPTGSGSGGTGGTGSGGGIGILPRSPTPAPTRTPPVPPAGFGRFSVIVYDNATGRPLPDVCVVIGTQTCGPTAPHTDANGRWSADVPVTGGTTYWDMYFIKTGYATATRKLALSSGATVTFSIFMRRSF